MKNTLCVKIHLSLMECYNTHLVGHSFVSLQNFIAPALEYTGSFILRIGKAA